ncbi:MAG: N-acetylglucosamine kinase [Hyphomicrobiaceae bacterium]|nr:N-acetylglucosamine kinase [Hyphomicrobiaceae bacterium]
MTFFLGVDGGGTGTRARLVDRTGSVLGAGSSGPSSLRLGVDAAWAAARKAADAAVQEAGLPADALSEVAACFSLAGLGRKGAREGLERKSHPFGCLAFSNDAEAARMGAHAGADGAIVIIGTGSVGFGILSRQEIRIGGYGFPISDEGSGAQLGLAALRATLQAHDGASPRSAMTADVMNQFGDDPFGIVAWMDRATATDYARFAPAVVSHAGAGDDLAQTLMRDAAREISRMIQALQQRGRLQVCLLGGLSAIMSPLVDDDARTLLRDPLGDAMDGAILLARRAAGQLA